jgi:hypothetical protein
LERLFLYKLHKKGVFNMKNIFRLFAIIAFVAIIGFSFIACGGDDPDPKPDPNPPPTTATVSVTGVSMEKTSTTILVGNTETLYATVLPDNATNKSITWVSNNTAVATVSNGTVTAKAAGQATITVTTVDGGKTATCSVTVNAITYTVKYNENGGTGTTASSDHTVGTSKALTANGFTRSGYLFVCWTINEGGTGTRYYNGQSVTDLTTTATTVNLYAQWAEGNMYYGVTSTASLNALKGTGGSLNVFNTALANPKYRKYIFSSGKNRRSIRS